MKKKYILRNKPAFSSRLIADQSASYSYEVVLFIYADGTHTVAQSQPHTVSRHMSIAFGSAH